MNARGRPPRTPAADRPDWAKRLIQARNDAGLSQAELAEKVGVSQSTIADYEIGRTEPPRRIVLKLGSALSIDPFDIVFAGYSSERGSKAIEQREREGAVFVFQDSSANDLEFMRLTREATKIFQRRFPLHQPSPAGMVPITRMVWRLVMQMPDAMSIADRVNAALSMYETMLQTDGDEFREPTPDRQAE